MKVVVLSSLAYSLVNFRGALLASMVEAGHEVTACAPDADDAITRTLSGMGIGFSTVRMARTGMNPLQDLRTLWDLFRLMRRERPDVVLAYTQKPIIYGGIAARLAGRTRFFAMCSGLGHAFSNGAGFRPRLLRQVVSRLYRVAVAKADAVFVFNRDDAGEMRKFGIVGPGHILVQVPGSGICTDSFEQAPLPAGPPTFLMVARLMWDKGLAEFVAAARETRAVCPEARFQLLGPFDANPNSISPDELKVLQDEGVIEYLGETRDVRPFLARSTVFVLPTYYREGLPRTILEAMATGRAIVTTDMPGCRETVFTGDDENGILIPPRDSGALARAMLRLASEEGMAVRLGNASRRIAEAKFDVRKVNALLLGTMGLLKDHREPIRTMRSGTSHAATKMRRGVDIITALLGLIVTAPLMAFLSLGVWFDIGIPVLFRQRRAGLGGRAFSIAKFRSMRDTRDEQGDPLPDAARTTAFGRFLRRSRLDELPELWNVLVGDMSLFGPRPLLPETIAAYGLAGEERCSVRPGLTGWAQVHGGPLLEPHEKLDLDIWYIRNRGMGLDLSIFVRTLAVLVRDDRVNSHEVGRAHASFDSRRG